MFRFTMADGREKSIDLNVERCMQARLDGKSWNAIGTIHEHRASLYGMHCNVANLMAVRVSPEWAEEADKFAEAGGHDVTMIRRMMISVPRGARPIAPAPAPAPTPPPTAPTPPPSAPTATLETVSLAGHTIQTLESGPLTGWVETPSGAVNLKQCDYIWKDDGRGEDGGVYAETVNGVEVQLYEGEHVDAFHEWLLTSVIGVARFTPPAEDFDEEDEEMPDAPKKPVKEEHYI